MLGKLLDLYPPVKQLVPSPLLLLPMPSLLGKLYLKRVMSIQDKPIIILCALPPPFLGSKSKGLPRFIFGNLVRAAHSLFAY